MAVVFLEVGQEVHFEGGSLEEAVQEGIRLGYTEGYLRNPLLEIPFCESIPGTIHPACSIMKLCPETA